MTVNEMFALRKDFVKRKHKAPTEAYMHIDDIIDIFDEIKSPLLGPADYLLGMRLIASDVERGKPILTYSRIDS